MLLTDITRIIRVLLATFETVASQDAFTRRRIGQIGQVIGAVEDVAVIEEGRKSTIADKRVEEAHDIIHRVAAILAMEEEGGDKERDDGGDEDTTGDTGADDVEAEETAEQEANAGRGDDEPLDEVPWDGRLDGETIELEEEGSR